MMIKYIVSSRIALVSDDCLYAFHDGYVLELSAVEMHKIHGFGLSDKEVVSDDECEMHLIVAEITILTEHLREIRHNSGAANVAIALGYIAKRAQDARDIVFDSWSKSMTGENELDQDYSEPIDYGDETSDEDEQYSADDLIEAMRLQTMEEHGDDIRVTPKDANLDYVDMPPVADLIEARRLQAADGKECYVKQVSEKDWESTVIRGEPLKEGEEPPSWGHGEWGYGE